MITLNVFSTFLFGYVKFSCLVILYVVCAACYWQFMINDHGMVLFCVKDCYSEFDLLFSLRNVC